MEPEFLGQDIDQTCLVVGGVTPPLLAQPPTVTVRAAESSPNNPLKTA